jgi:hypothetical protein
MNNQKLVTILLRISIASVFLYAAVAATLEPFNWIGYLPSFALKILPGQQLLLGFSAYQLALSIWILSGWKSFYSASLAALTFLGIIGVNFSDVDILFRDFAIFFSAVALAIGSYGKTAATKK